MDECGTASVEDTAVRGDVGNVVHCIGLSDESTGKKRCHWQETENDNQLRTLSPYQI